MGYGVRGQRGTAWRVANTRAGDKGSPLAEKAGKDILRGRNGHRPEMWDRLLAQFAGWKWGGIGYKAQKQKGLSKRNHLC